MKWFTQTDKLQHFVVGTYIYMLLSIDFGFLWPWVVVTIAAVGRETLGYFFKGKKFSWEDIIVTLFGAFCSYILVINHYQNCV